MALWRWFRGLPGILQGILGILGVFVLLSLDWRPSVVRTVPALLDEGHATGALSAGAARISIDPPFPTPIGGFNARGNHPFEGILTPLGARALVLQVEGKRVGLVSVELCVLPAVLRRKVLAAVADLHLDEVFLGATHTHSGLGGYWDNRIAEWIGLASYNPRIEEFLVHQLADVLRQASSGMRPARLAVGSIDASNYAYNRDDEHGAVDTLLKGARVIALDGTPIANVVLYAVHPTIIQMGDMHLSGDWPGSMMASLEAEGGPPSLFFQGAVGDITWGKRLGDMSRQERAVRFGQAVAGDARGAIAAGGQGEAEISLDWARAEVGLPKCDLSGVVPKPLDRFVSNLFCWVAGERTTEVSSLRAGQLELASVPGEVVAGLGIAWRKALDGAFVTSLMDDYIGYVEAPARVEAGQGEAKHSYFGSALAPVLFEGLRVTHTAARREPPPIIAAPKP
jgi:hypothetical protein